MYVLVGFDKFRQFYSSLFVNNGLFIQTCNKLTFTNLIESSKPQDYESVDSIRELAPSSFRIGGRLVTENDYKTYILSNYKNRIHDIFVCNNTTYITLFYNWLYRYGKLNMDIRKQNYRFTDTCDFNNVYLWMKPLYNR
jgi:hypothetical protein